MAKKPKKIWLVRLDTNDNVLVTADEVPEAFRKAVDVFHDRGHDDAGERITEVKFHGELDA